MNIRNDIYEKVKFMLKEAPDIKINYAKLGRQFNCDPRTVKKHVEAVREEKPVSTRVYSKKTDGFEQIIEEKVKTGAPAIAIYHYLVKYKGYSGSYSTLKSYIHNLHRSNQQTAVIRFETTPGLQAQVDWKESLKFKTVDGEVIKFNIFLLTLGFSRFRFLMATESRDFFQVEFCLACAFKYIGGVPHEILFDNMRSIIDKARTQYSEPVFNNEFSLFAADCGFVSKACVAYRPETKGKVEVTAKLMNRLKVYSGDIHSLMYWNDAVSKCRSSGMTVRDWCNREGINEKTYYYWQRKIFMAAAKETEFVEIPNTGNKLSGQIIATVSSNDFTVDVHQGADKESLTELLSAIKLC